MTFYIDLILMENIIMNYIIILTTGIICSANIKQARILLSSILGGLYAIISYLLDLNIYSNQIFKIVLSICIVYISFNSKNIKVLLKQLLIFYLTSFCFGGVAYYLLYCVSPNLIKIVNGLFVGTYPIKIAIMGAILGFIIINISFKTIKYKLTKSDIIYNIDIFYNENKCSVKVILDTGNLLTDPITNIPVLIIETEKLVNILPKEILQNTDKILYDDIFEDMNEKIKRRCCIIPFSSIGKNNGIIIGFRPDYIIINNESNEIRKKVIIGLYNKKISRNGMYSGLMGLNLLNDDIRSR